MPSAKTNYNTNVNLGDDKFIKRLSLYIDWISDQDSLDDAKEAKKAIDEWLNDRNLVSSIDNQTVNIYKGYYYRLAAVCIPFLDDKEFKDLLVNHLDIVLNIKDLSLVDKIRGHFAGMLIHEERDSLKKEIKEDLLKSQTRIISNLSVGSILLSYQKSTSTGEKDVYAREKYLNESELFKKLSVEEIAQIRKILDVYDFMSLSSLSPEGVEDVMTFNEDGHTLVFNKGEVYEIQSNDPVLNKIIKINNPKIEQSLTVPDLGFLNNPPLVLKQPSPAFLFDESDEREIDKLRPKVEAILSQGNLVLEQELRELADEVIKEHNFSFKDEVSKKRFVQLFVSFLKDIRGLVEVRDVLLKSLENGGLGLTSEKTEAVIKILRQAKKDFDEGGRKKLKTKSKNELDKLIEAEAADAGLLNNKIETKKEVVDKIVYQKPAVPEKKFEDLAKMEADRQSMLKELAAKAAAQQMAELSKINEQKTLVKNQMSDIKAPPRVLGPMEELKTLGLDDFRRLGGTPQDIIHKLQSKIDLLGEKSVARRLEAVRSWQGSPIYKLYLSLGRESIEEGRHVDIIIKEKIDKKEICLSLEEFNAIADFNSKLRF